MNREPKPSDVTVTCPCCGAAGSIPITSFRRLCRLASPAHEAELHRLATGQTNGSPMTTTDHLAPLGPADGLPEPITDGFPETATDAANDWCSDHPHMLWPCAICDYFEGDPEEATEVK